MGGGVWGVGQFVVDGDLVGGCHGLFCLLGFGQYGYGKYK